MDDAKKIKISKYIESYISKKSNLRYDLDDYINEKIISNNFIFFMNEDSLKKQHLFTKLASHLVFDHILEYMSIINNYICSEYKLDKIELKEYLDDNIIKNYKKIIKQLEGTQEGKLIDWVYDELLLNRNSIEDKIFIENYDYLLTFEKIRENNLDIIKNIDLSKGTQSIIKLMNAFYDFRDRLKKNKIYLDSNTIRKKLIEIKQSKTKWNKNGSSISNKSTIRMGNFSVHREESFSIKSDIFDKKRSKKNFENRIYNSIGEKNEKK